MTTSEHDTAILERYRRERDRRRQRGRADAPELVGDLARYLDDPYVEPIRREPIEDEVDALVVGAGLGGLQIGARLRQAGIDRVRLVDVAGDVGGVWYWNRYPGAMCDVESLIYLPMIEETGYLPTLRYALQPEIHAYARRLAEQFGLVEHALFQTAVNGLRWNDDDMVWEVSTDRGDRIRARFVAIANGGLSVVKLPAIDGLERFRGASWHTSRWDYAYTGGGPTEEMTGLADKRVGIIGTGATALQAVPPLARSAEHLYVFQRTPSTVGVRNNRPIPRDWLDGREPGWQRERMENFTDITTGVPVEVDLVGDGWTDIHHDLLAEAKRAEATGRDPAAAMQEADIRKMDRLRERIDSIVDDPETAESLKAYYNYMCKRAGFHDEYLDAFNRPNVTLVDTRGRGIDRITERGVVVDGQEIELDAIVHATGFVSADAPSADRVGFEIVGIGGRTIREAWADGVRSLHGLVTSGFPNLFLVPSNFQQSTVCINVTHLLTETSRHIAWIVGALTARGIPAFDVDPAAEDAWGAPVVAHAHDNDEFNEACTPNRFNNEGEVGARNPRNANYPLPPTGYFRLLAEWREREDFEGLRLRKVAEPV